jgi:rhamnose utilization protein RhaD (predicted bifunctional aldolase and dehydrogenase)
MSIPYEIVTLSRYYGKNPDYVIAGGGNTSYKEGDRLWIKTSGISLADIDESGFVCLSRKKLNRISDAVYSKDPAKREEEVKRDLMAAIIDDKNKRPSVETLLHNLFNYRFVIHTHPTMVNALLCSQNAKYVAEELFGREVMFVEYTDPGYTLFKKIQGILNKYLKIYDREPGIIFMKNHGMIVCGENAGDVNTNTDKIIGAISSRFKKRLPSLDFIAPLRSSQMLINRVNDYLGSRNLVSAYGSNKLIEIFVKNSEEFSRISHPFTPDNIVYCKSEYLLAGGSDEKVISDIEAFEGRHGFFPRIIGIEKTGLISVGDSEQSAARSLEVFQDMMKISFLSDNFGGPEFLGKKEIDFIDSWEAEHYRRKL